MSVLVFVRLEGTRLWVTITFQPLTNVYSNVESSAGSNWASAVFACREKKGAPQILAKQLQKLEEPGSDGDEVCR